MTATAVREDRPVSGGARVSAALWRRAWLRATLTLSPPLAWFLVIYLASLLVMLVTAFWTLLVSPISWTHHWVWVVPLIVLLVSRLPKTTPATAWRRWLGRICPSRMTGSSFFQ